jgi:UDP-N-acetylmuramyl pentapeptide phosphotransferase/UDP-N-acetylglucosamine-1-phosphate transferase
VIQALAVSALGSVAAALVATWLIAKNATRLGLMDVPNERSSHRSATPRGGGLGIVAGVTAGILLLAAFGEGPGPQLEVLLAGAAAIAVLGAIDDVHPLRAAYRLVIQLLVATAVVVALGDVGRLPLPPPLDVSVGWLGGPLTVVWLVGATNFYNFMDGIDGLAAGQAVASCIGVALAAWSLGAVQFGLVLAASAVGFLVLNKPPARVFLGDAGSTSLGFAIAGLPLLAPSGQRPFALFAVALGLSLFLFDPVETLLRLARTGHRIGTAHRSHSYQLLASTVGRRGVVAGSLVGAGLVLAIGGGLAYRTHWLAWPVALLALCTYAVEMYLAGRTDLRSTRPARLG